MYEFSDWLDTIKLEMPKSVRQINERIFKIFTKEVFIKSLIQGRDFRYLEAVDLDLYGVTHFPAFIQKEASNRKLLIVETKHIWFIVSPSETLGSNPFSLRRFLAEDITGGFAYFNGLALTKSLCDKPEVQEVMLKFVNRIFSLDRNISDELKKYAIHIRKMVKEQFTPILLDSKFTADGSSAEKTIARRIIKFEELLTSSVLRQLPTMISIAKNSEFDQEFLFHRLNGFFNELLILIKNFRMHPLARHAFVAQHLQLRVLALDVLIQKNRGAIFDPTISTEELREKLGEAMNDIRESYEEGLNNMAEIEELIANTKAYDDKKASGGFFAKLGFGKPKYTMEELREAKQELNEEFFVEIVRLAKKHKQAIVYVEYETDFEINEDYRHYAIANESYGLARLPYIIALPEDRETFSLEALKDDVYWEIFDQIYNV
ncbi:MULTISPECIES: hypothetical protein [Moraxella]|uniref:Uncharacterized protein n=2 Tax=Moraxella lacunata TaxID=477 RepID=A0A1B8Q1S6_MORLA|nr:MULTISPECIES: hypothetical protein [Moraxella]MBE9578584.1 hypothetical protein [Moraxella sp. K1664]MBE9588209.1 hypothetical protein [Moraxella sp. K1630]MBE9596093.1 hypothetical protein [Moraxella sp. K2450]MDH9218398.1 hypothetical protein [Moraxella lacunata]MDI4482629.1 hypothetical protein [Moraxella lacunata]